MAERINPSDEKLWNSYGLEHIQRYQWALPFCDGKSVLDYGCGLGFGAEIIAANGAAFVTGIDIDSNIISEAAKRSDQKNISFTANTSHIPAEVDVVTCFEVIEHIDEQEETVKWIAERLKPQGLCILSAPNRLMFSGNLDPITNEFHKRELSYSEARQLLDPHFRIIREFEQTAFSVIPNYPLWAEIQNSLLLRLERKLKAPHSAGGRDWLRPDPMLYRTEIIPLIKERRAECHQFLFVGMKW